MSSPLEQSGNNVTKRSWLDGYDSVALQSWKGDPDARATEKSIAKHDPEVVGERQAERKSFTRANRELRKRQSSIK